MIGHSYNIHTHTHTHKNISSLCIFSHVFDDSAYNFTKLEFYHCWLSQKLPEKCMYSRENHLCLCLFGKHLVVAWPHQPLYDP